MKLRFVKSILTMIGAFALTACASGEVVVREPVRMSSYPAENHVAANMIISHHVRMAAPEGWHFHSKEKDQSDEVLFWIRDNGSNSIQGVVRLNKLDFYPDLRLLAPRYGELAMAKFNDKEVHETEIDGFPSQIITGKHQEDSTERMSALVSTGSTNLVEVTFASRSQQLLANPSLPYSILNSYKLMPGNLSARYIRDSFSFRCDDGQWIWINDMARAFMKGGYTVAGLVNRSLVLVDVAQVSTTQFRDLYKMQVFDVPEFETEIHLAGQAFPARAIGHHVDSNKHTSSAFLFKHANKDYLLGITWVSKKSEPAEPKTMHELPAIREVLDKYFTFAG